MKILKHMVKSLYADKIILIFHSRTLTYLPFLYLFDVKFCKKAFTKQVMILAIQTSCDLTPIILGAHFVYGQNDNLTIFERKHVQRKGRALTFISFYIIYVGPYTSLKHYMPI